MQFISWNVNGLRACVKKGFANVFTSLSPDFFCIQETKLQQGQLDLTFPGYTAYFYDAEKKGYSGTAIYTRHSPLKVTYGLPEAEHNHEGRLITLEYPHCYVVTCYTPNAQAGLKRLPYRKNWDDAFRLYLVTLNQHKKVIFCGDLNVAHQDIDLKNPQRNHENPGFSDSERENFTQLLASGFIDTWRWQHPTTTDVYSWWSYRFHAREHNAGWRIDYFGLSQEWCNLIAQTDILTAIQGSDHCPIGLTLTLKEL